jgi:hypothetical protein
MSWWREGGLKRPIRLVLLATSSALVVSGLLLVPDLIRFLPGWVRYYPVEWTTVLVFAAVCLISGLAGYCDPDKLWVEVLTRVSKGIDSCSRVALGRGLVVGFAVLGVVWLAAWLPHYLYWPWCRDVDTFAVIAQAWDAGELPYRDIRGYNFPGHIYLHWILGKLFGWGHTGVFYGVDALALFALGAVLLAWSRRCLGLLLPGLTSYLIFLGYYLDIHFEIVAERDWHAALGATLGLLMLQAWPGRRALWLSALLTAVAFTIRPHVILFLPALVMATMKRSGAAEGQLDAQPSRSKSLKREILAALEWFCALGIFVAAAFTPLMYFGLLDDLISGLRVTAYSGPYRTTTPVRSIAIFLEQVREPKNVFLLLSLGALGFRSRSGILKPLARTWLLALAGALLYRPIHPVDHGYLKTPLALISAVAWAIPVAWIIRAAQERRRSGPGPFLGVLMIGLIVYESIPVCYPRNCSFRASLNSIRAAARGGWPDLPPGAWIWYSPERQDLYKWDAYCRLLRYVRQTTSPKTVVANILNSPPFPSVNGPTGRRSPFHVESGIAWMWLINEDLEPQFTRELEESGPDSVVVWLPEETNSQPRLPLRRLSEVILNEYTPEARFDKFEVWRRKRKTAE